MGGQGADPLSWSLLSNSDPCRSKRKSDFEAANLPIEETELAQRCDGVEKKKGLNENNGKWEMWWWVGAPSSCLPLLCSEDHHDTNKDVPSLTPPESAESAHAGNSSSIIS